MGRVPGESQALPRGERRAWGPGIVIAEQAAVGQFTPTGVGTTLPHAYPASWKAVHPHGRGDHSLVLLMVWLLLGSPPRAWGPRPRLIKAEGHRRFTPTGVGTTPEPAGPRRRRTVHPHGRGDHSAAWRCRRSSSGSPPRAWGPRRGNDLGLRHRRFTPTGVGKTLRLNARTILASVRFTPTGVGKTSIVFATVVGLRVGSPPRAWGRRVDINDVQHGMAFGSPPRAWGRR